MALNPFSAGYEFGIGRRNPHVPGEASSGTGLPAAGGSANPVSNLVASPHFWSGLVIFGSAALLWYATDAHVSGRVSGGVGGIEGAAGAELGQK